MAQFVRLGDDLIVNADHIQRITYKEDDQPALTHYEILFSSGDRPLEIAKVFHPELFEALKLFLQYTPNLIDMMQNHLQKIEEESYPPIFVAFSFGDDD